MFVKGYQIDMKHNFNDMWHIEVDKLCKNLI